MDGQVSGETQGRVGAVLLLALVGCDQGELRGPCEDGQFGKNVAVVGDIDGDGALDLGISSFRARGTASMGCGSVRVVSSTSGKVLFEREGRGWSWLLGTAILQVGDIDGDGVGDLAAGAPQSSAGGEVGGGLVERISGKTGALLGEIPSMPGESDFGIVLERLGDVDGDGLPEVAVGAPGGAPKSRSGKVVVVSVSNGRRLGEFSGREHSGYGGALASPGDIDGDGLRDLVVSEPSRGPGEGTWASTVRAQSVKSKAELWSRTWDFWGVGKSLAVAGDVDGDGIREIVVGGPEPTGSETPGRVLLLSGKTGRTLWESTTEPGDRSFGTRVASGHDVDGDRCDDVLVGCPFFDRGAVSGAGRVLVLSGRDGHRIREFAGGGKEREYFGFSFQFVGDLTKDGVPDIAIGAPFTTIDGFQRAGRVVLVSGADGSPLREFVQ